MEFFASDEQVAQLEADLATAQAGARMPLLLALAWALRQRDCERALQLAREVEAGLSADAEGAHAMLLRVTLLRANVKWLFGEFDAARLMVEQVLQGFEALGDVLGCADAHWLLARIVLEQGSRIEEAEHLGAMRDICVQLDPVRLVVAQSMIARGAAVINARAAKAQWGEYFSKLSQDPALHQAAQFWVTDFLGLMANLRSDYVATIRYLTRSWSHARISGQMARAIIAACTIGDAFNRLNDHHSALEWLQRGLLLAREKKWPVLMGLALMQTVETLRHLQRYDNAYQLLTEALNLMAPMSQSRHYAIALGYLGRVELARQQYAGALQVYQSMEQRAVALQQADLHTRALRGKARALLELGQPEAALDAAELALTTAGSNSRVQIQALQMLATIHARHPLPAPAGMSAPTIPLHYLQQALALAQSMKRFTVPGELLEAMAQEYAQLGDYATAWEWDCKAAAAREMTHSNEANNRAHAMQLTHQSEREQAQAAYQRELASEARRAEILQQTSDTLQHLGAIGQEITAHLDAQQVFEALHHHIHHLFEVTSFVIYLLDSTGTTLIPAFAIENGQPFTMRNVAVQDLVASSARCVRERREILMNHDPQPGQPTWVPGTVNTRSALFAPLMLAERVLGVMTVQNARPEAYDFGAREQMIFRTLCAYTAIALANAETHGELAQAHRQLQDTQQQMVLQGKMAGLGSLTAGVAHEINNPANFVHVAAQNQRADLEQFEQFVLDLVEADAAPEILDDFQQHFARLNENVATMLNGTGRIKGIVRDLRAFTRIDSEDMQTLNLMDCLLSTLNLVRTSWQQKVEFVTEFEAVPKIACWPALMNQVFMNLLVNGCQAIEEKRKADGNAGTPGSERSKLWLRLFQQEGLLVIEFEDSGIGITPEQQARIMEPFYTTKTVGQGTGLGLSIAFGIVQKHGGHLGFTSLPGQGSCFTIHLPLSPTAGATARKE